MRRVLKGAAIVLAAVLALVILAVIALTSTDFGRERVRRIALDVLRERVAGDVQVGRVTGNLLGGVALHDVVIADSAGNPFLTVDELRTGYGLRALAMRRIILDEVRLVRPVIVLDRPPGGRWNFRRIFPSDTAAVTGEPSAWGKWVVFRDVEIVDGRLVVRTPWWPDSALAEPVRDSIARARVAGAGRSEVVVVPGGWQEVMEFRDLDAMLAEVRLAHPEHESKLIAIDSMAMIAAPFRPPLVEVRSLAGDFQFDGDSLWFEETRVGLPGTSVAGQGRYVFEPRALGLELRGDPVALADLRWLYPRLPSDGGGKLDFALSRVGDTSRYVARDAEIRVRESWLAGDFGLTLDEESVRFHDTDLQATSFDTRLIEQLVPSLDLPVTGSLDGRAVLAGPLRAMRVDTDLALTTAGMGRSRVIAVGEVGVGEPGGLRASNLRVRAAPVQMALVRSFVEGLPLGGMLTGSALVNGSARTQLAARTDVVHEEAGARSHIVGDARFRFGREPWVDIDAEARPVALATVGRFTPLTLRGVGTGPVRVRGTMRDLSVETHMAVSGGGEIQVTGRLDLASADPAYDIALGFWVFNLNAIVAEAPVTSLSATAAVQGRGTDPATMRASAVADVTTSHWSEVAVDSAVMRVAVADGLLSVDSLRLRAPNTRLDVEGSFGFRPERTGEIAYRLAIDSLADFARWLPLDTGVVAPRPGRVARAREAADSVARRLAAETEVERAITGEPAPRVAPALPPAIPRDSITGSVYAAGVLGGNLDRFELRGRATTLDLTVFGNSVGSARAEYQLIDGGTENMAIVAAAEAGEVITAGFEFDSVNLRIAHREPRGDLLVSVRQGDAREYDAVASYALELEANELRFERLTLRFDTTVWAATHPGTVRWGGRGVAIDSLELRSGEIGRIFVSGLLPTEGEANLAVALDNFEIAHLVDLLQADIPAAGLLTIGGSLTGTMSDPAFRGALGLFEGRYGGTVLPQLNGTFSYADRRLEASVVASRTGGLPLAAAEATLPLNLAFTGVTGSRFLDLPASAELVADSLPLDVLPSLTDAVTNVRGRVIGSVAMRGTLLRPALAGALAVDLGSFGIAATGTLVRDIGGYLRLQGDTIVIDSLVGRAGGPLRVAGGLGVDTWTAPSFDLRLVAANAFLLDNDQGRLRADADLTMRGAFDDALIEGTARIRGGVIYVDESGDKDVVNARDPALFSIVDTSAVELEDLVPEESPLLRNLRVNVALTVDRDTWLRSTNANVEMYGDLAVNVNQRRRALAVDGSVNTDRGEYTFLSRRFHITRGSATFIGVTELNPTLQITGNYEVPIPGREGLNIRVLIGGTLKMPKLTLESDAQPPISQSDLLSYLAFGRSSTSLLRPGTTLSGASGGGELVGVGAALAGQQLTSVALGVALEELEGEASRSAGLDVFNITPGELPPEFWRADIEGFLRGTEIEAGRYLSRNTFVAVQGYPDLRIPGARIEYRISDGFTLQGLYETRYLVTEPTLGETDPQPASAFGAILTREWRFSSRRPGTRSVGLVRPGDARRPAPTSEEKKEPQRVPRQDEW